MPVTGRAQGMRRFSVIMALVLTAGSAWAGPVVTTSASSAEADIGVRAENHDLQAARPRLWRGQPPRICAASGACLQQREATICLVRKPASRAIGTLVPGLKRDVCQPSLRIRVAGERI